jgi:trk system potassium uptake protein TrkA
LEALVIGLGVFGRSLATNLAKQGANVIAVDKDQELVDKVKDVVEHAIVLDATTEDNLRQIGVEDIDAAFICMGVNMEASILTTLLVKKIGVPKIIARSNNEEHSQILSLIGAHHIVAPEVEMGEKVAKQYTNKNLVSLIELSYNAHMAELLVTERLFTKSLRKLNLRQDFGVNIVGIKQKIPDIDKKGNNIYVESLDPLPDPDYQFKEGDIVVVIGDPKNVERFSDYLIHS